MEIADDLDSCICRCDAVDIIIIGKDLQSIDHISWIVQQKWCKLVQLSINFHIIVYRL